MSVWAEWGTERETLFQRLHKCQLEARGKAEQLELVEDSEPVGVSSYLEARGHLWLYLTEDWFRLTEDEVDAKNNHQGRAKTWSVWEGIQKAVTGVVKEIVRFSRPPKIDMESLYRQTMGCLCKMAVFEGLERELESAGAVLRYFFNKVRAHGAADFWRIMERHLEEKHNRLGFAPVLNM